MTRVGARIDGKEKYCATLEPPEEGRLGNLDLVPLHARQLEAKRTAKEAKKEAKGRK